jgi:predicted RNase H-related nuclease YkuK (DUF458 family)
MDSVLQFLANTSNLDGEQRIKRLKELQLKEFYAISISNGLDSNQLKETAKLIKGMRRFVVIIYSL